LVKVKGRWKKTPEIDAAAAIFLNRRGYRSYDHCFGVDYQTTQFSIAIINVTTLIIAFINFILGSLYYYYY
jgi:hypothetical protein